MSDPRQGPSRGEGAAGQEPGPRRPQSPFSGRAWLITLILVLLFNFVFYPLILRNNETAQKPQTTLPYSVFLDQVRANNVTTAQIAGSTVSGDFAKGYKDPTSGKSYARYTTTLLLPVQDPDLLRLLKDHKVQLSAVNQTPPAWLQVLGLLLDALPFLFLIGLIYFATRAARRQQQGIFGVGQSKAKVYTEERPSTTFADVAGVEAAKAELGEVVDFLRTPGRYQDLGAKIPKGVLLLGPPGTGKTLLARAVAGEAHVPFFSISSSEFVEMFVGVGASRVRDLFEKATAAAPAIVFIDEIDAIGRHRGGGVSFGGTNEEREQTLNQLLVSMDGFEPNQAVIVLAATNRPDVLDPALLRPGRFDRQITVDLPDRRGREAILRVHTRTLPLAPTVDLDALAATTPGMSGADLANLANEAALTAARMGASQVTTAHFEAALDRITLGAPGTALMNEEERRTVAYHEGGHALVALLLPTVDPVHRVTIIPRGRSLGVTQFRPIDDRRNFRRDFLLDRMAVGLAGRAAEETACDEVTSGAQNDLQQVTALARAMVTQLGMADELSLRSFGGAGDEALGGRSYNPLESKEYSEETARRIDVAIDRLIDEAHERARRVLRENRATLDAIAAALLRDESLNREELTQIVNAHRAPGQEPLPVPAGSPTGQAEGTGFGDSRGRSAAE